MVQPKRPLRSSLPSLKTPQCCRVPSNPIDHEAVVAAHPITRNDWLVAIALVAAVFLIYMPCWHGGFLWDDESHLLNNPVLTPGGLAKVWVPGGYLNYWPLTYTAYWLQFQLWGLQPLGFHLVNLALHALSALLVWRVLLRLEIPGALFAAAIFALHPVNVETAAWIAHLKVSLSLALALVSMLFYLDSERYASRWRYGLALAAFLLSALAEGTAVTLPIVLLACAWWQRGRIGGRDLLRVSPYFLIGAVAAGIEVWAQHSVAIGVDVRSDDFFSRLAVAGCALWFYLGKIILPLNLCPFYPRWSIDERSILSYLPGVMWLIVLGIAWWKRRTWGRPVVMLMICYAALLLPILGFVNIYFMRFSLVSDHWQYIGTIVPCAVFAGAATILARRFVVRPAAIMAAVSLLVVLGVLSLLQSRMYADGETFYETTVARNPDCWVAQYYIALALNHRGEYDAAIARYKKALEIKPDYADADNNLANLLVGRRQYDSAIAYFHKALEIKPDFFEAHYNLALALVDCGQYDSAIAHYQRALEIKPGNAEVHNNLGKVLAHLGRIDAAIAHYQKALEIKPDYAEAHVNLGLAVFGRGQIESAISHFQKALEIKPNFAEAHDNLATALARSGRVDSAIVHYQRALEIKPDYAEAHYDLGNVLLGARQVDLGHRALREGTGNKAQLCRGP